MDDTGDRYNVTFIAYNNRRKHTLAVISEALKDGITPTLDKFTNLSVNNKNTMDNIDEKWNELENEYLYINIIY